VKSTIVGMYDAKANFTKLVARAEAGEEIIVSRGGKPVAKLVAYAPPVTRRQPGRLKGRIRILDGFDETPPEFAEAFGLDASA